MADDEVAVREDVEEGGPPLYGEDLAEALRCAAAAQAELEKVRACVF